MQEVRYSDQGRMDDRLTGAATEHDIARALHDKATRKVVLHKPGSTFYARVGGERKRFRVLSDGTLRPEARRRTKGKQPKRGRRG